MRRAVTVLSFLPRRFASKKARARQEEAECTVVQLASRNAPRAQRLYGFGFAATGALGVRSLVRPKRAKEVPLPVQRFAMRLPFFAHQWLQVRAVSCGYGFTVFVCREDGGEWTLYGCGLNSESQLGLQPRCTRGEVEGHYVELVEEPQPIDVPLSSDKENAPEDVACGRAHTLFYTTNGQLYSLGSNCFGQCGREVIAGEQFRSSRIVSRVHVGFEDAEDRIADIVCGQDHSLVLTKRGHVFSFGLGSDGQLGLGHFDNVSVPCRVRGAIETSKIRQISSRGDTVLAVCDAGHVYGWGNSEYNQLSKSEIQLSEPQRLFEGVELGHVSQVAASGSMCAVLNTEGRVFVWGFGALGLGPRVSLLEAPRMLPPPLFGANEYDPEARVVAIAAGLHNFLALNNRGTLFSWGANRSGCLGLAHDDDQSFPLRVTVPAEVKSMRCGVDHMIIMTRAFA